MNYFAGKLATLQNYSHHSKVFINLYLIVAEGHELPPCGKNFISCNIVFDEGNKRHQIEIIAKLSIIEEQSQF